MTDKKIEDYLERAKLLLSNKVFGYHTKEFQVEIAKMIQLEEHQQEFIDLNKSKL